MANNERLLELKGWVRKQWTLREAGQPSEWDQTSWAQQYGGCGTACCVAGKAALNAGWKPVFEDGVLFTIVFEKEGRLGTADTLAQDLLGLTDEQADHLFRSSNTVGQIEDLIDRIVAGTYDDVDWQDHLDWDFLELDDA